MGVNTGTGGARRCSTECCGEEEPDAECTTAAACQGFGVTSSGNVCGFYDHDATGMIAPIPSDPYGPTVTVSGATGDLSPLNGSWSTDATSGGIACNGCFNSATAAPLSWNKLHTYHVDGCPGSGVRINNARVTVNMWPRGNFSGIVVNAGVRLEWCADGGNYGAQAGGNWNCSEGGWYDVGVSNPWVGDVNTPWAYTGTPPTDISVTVPNSGVRNACRRVGLSSMEEFRKQATRWLACGGSFSPSFLTLKIYNGTTNAEIGSSPISTPWTASGSCYIHDPINITTTASLAHSAGLKGSIWWGDQELTPTRPTFTCVLTGLENPLPAGTVLAVTPFPFRFTGSTDTYSVSRGHLLDQYFLLMTSPNLSLEVVHKVSGVVESTYSVGWECVEESSTFVYVKSTGDVLLNDGVNGGELYVQNTDGVGIVELGNAGSLYGGCERWFPASFLQWRT